MVNARYIVRRVSNPQQWVVIDTETHESLAFGNRGDSEDAAVRKAQELNAVPVDQHSPKEAT